MVEGHVAAVKAFAAGVRGLPSAGSAFAATQAAWRFFANERVTLATLIEPLREVAREACGEDAGRAGEAGRYVLLAHDWSKLAYPGHAAKADQTRLTSRRDVGYELATRLLVDAGDGAPIAPVDVGLLAADGMHGTAADAPGPRRPHAAQVLPAMEAAATWGLAKRPVHVVDREGDSLKHLRSWHAAGHLFLVRANDRRASRDGVTRRLSEWAAVLRGEEPGAFADAGAVVVRGRSGRQRVAALDVVLDGPAFTKRPDRTSYRVPGEPLPLRFVVAEVVADDGERLAEWFLLTNVPAAGGEGIGGEGAGVGPATLARWYYWRWRIESFHKLLKSAGLEIESWRQESAAAIAKRLLVGCMACVTVWRLERDRTPEAAACREFLMRLSGRQTKRSRPVTTPALLAGLQLLLTIDDVLADHTPAELHRLARTAAPLRYDTG